MQQMYPIVFLINISGFRPDASGLSPCAIALPFQGGWFIWGTT